VPAIVSRNMSVALFEVEGYRREINNLLSVPDIEPQLGSGGVQERPFDLLAVGRSVRLPR
jgi:hypothetical protein